MPINVTWVDCQYRFLVGDELAGRTGRCPECGAVIDVPDTGHPPRPANRYDRDPHLEPLAPDPFHDFPSRYRRQRDERERYEEDLREDFDDQPRRRSFDPEARAAAWTKVYKGLGYVQIAVILYFFGQILQMGFMLVRGGPKENPNGLPDSGEMAVGIGGLVVISAAAIFWCLGRAAGTRVPYVPARGWAKASFLMALGSLLCLFMFCCSLIGAIAAVAQQGPNPGAMLILMLAFMVLLVAVVVVVGAEITGLVSLAKIGDGLHAASAASWARQSIAALVVLIGMLTVGFCAFVIYVGQNAEQQHRAGQLGPANQNNGPA